MPQQSYTTPPAILNPHGIGAALSQLIETCHNDRPQPSVPHPILRDAAITASGQAPFSLGSLIASRQADLRTMFNRHNAQHLPGMTTGAETLYHNPTTGSNTFPLQTPSSQFSPNNLKNPIEVDSRDIDIDSHQSNLTGPSCYISLDAGSLQNRRMSIMSAITAPTNQSMLGGADQKFVERYRPRLAPPVSWQPEHTQALDEHLQDQTNYTQLVLQAVCSGTGHNASCVPPSLRPFITYVRGDHEKRLQRDGPENTRTVMKDTAGLCSEVVRNVAW